MEWVKLYTTFHDHRKTVDLDANAIALWTLCLSWSGAQETEGFIPRRIALRFLGGEFGDEAAARLVRVGLWQEVEGGYCMRNWDERQDGADLVHARRAANRQRQQRWRDRRNALRHAADNATRHAPRNVSPDALRDAFVMGAREEERREDQRDSPLIPPYREGHRVVVLPPGDDGFLPRSGEVDDFAAAYASAYEHSHSGKTAPPLLLREMVSAARVCHSDGVPAEDISEALARCARANETKEWQFTRALAEVQGGESRPPNGRRSRADIMRAWEARHSGTYE